MVDRTTLGHSQLYVGQDTYIPGVLAIAQVAFYEENIVEHDLLVNKNKQEKC